MTNRFTTLAAAAALFLNASTAVHAGDMTRLPSVDHWKMAADDEVCRAEGSYLNGTFLHFFINAKGGMYLGVSHPEWSIPDGSYNVTAQVDRAPATTFKANASDGWVVWEIVLNEHDLNLLSYGRTLSVTLGRWLYQYELTGTAAMLKALSKCAAARIAAANPNPFAGSPPAAASKTPASTETPSNPFRRL
jgi:hypothetical protein